MRHLITSFLLCVTFAAAAAAAELTFVVSDGDRFIGRGNASLDSMLEMRKQFGETFVWAERGGHRYLISDRAIAEQIVSAYAESRATKAEQKRVTKREKELRFRERQLAREENRYERELDAIGDGDASEHQEKELRLLLRDLADRQRKLAAEEEELERAERVLDAKREREEAEADRRAEKIIDAAIQNGSAREVR